MEGTNGNLPHARIIPLTRRQRFYRIERELPYPPYALPDFNRPAMPVIFLVLH
jgi:hypothetical protein